MTQRFTSVKVLKTMFPKESEECLKRIRSIAKFHGNKIEFTNKFFTGRAGTEKLNMLMFSMGYLKLFAINKEFKGFGIEAAYGDDDFYVDYVNAGDTYALTFYLDTNTNEIKIGDLETIDKVLKKGRNK